MTSETRARIRTTLLPLWPAPKSLFPAALAERLRHIGGRA